MKKKKRKRAISELKKKKETDKYHKGKIEKGLIQS